MVKLVEKILEAEDWNFASYHGQLKGFEKSNAVQMLEKGEISILLATIKSGGVGLNLTAANRVLIIDPWWNDAMMQQAACRVHRIGQQKDCHITVLIGKGFVETEMYKLQRAKKVEIVSVTQRHLSKAEMIAFYNFKENEIRVLLSRNRKERAKYLREMNNPSTSTVGKAVKIEAVKAESVRPSPLDFNHVSHLVRPFEV
jgi:SNF2 family DNA or RNA helicase